MENILNELDLGVLAENPKDFFNQRTAIINEIYDEAERIDRYRAAACSVSAKPSGGGGFTAGNTSNKLELFIVKADESEQKVRAKKDELKKVSAKIIWVMNNFIDDDLDRTICKFRFFYGMQWPSISERLKLSKRALLKRQEKFLKEISEKACTFTSTCGKI